jgi:hypothetical protein
MLNGQDVLLRLDVQGTATMRKLLGHDAVFIFMVVESEMALVKGLVERKTKNFGNVVCNCNFVILFVKYTHTCALSTGFKYIGLHNPIYIYIYIYDFTCLYKTM